MRCYYEELCVPRDSSDVDIKTAYRKLALKWHPDKNPDCLAEAKEKFQLIQQAYEVLSDAQERAWYDNHREQILRGKNSEYSEKCLDVFQYFTSSCYKGYGNDDQGFYSVYREVFVKIALEDQEFTDDLDSMDFAPEFGYANSSYEDVVGPFYAYWQAYSTKKTYEWLCPYDVREIKERFILRKVEKEMKKIVQSARKDRNEEVRNLVSFVRKRDRRVQAYRLILEERAEANRLKQEEKRKEQLRKRQQELAEIKKNRVVNEGYEEQLKQLEQQYGSDTDEYSDEDEEDENGSEGDIEVDDDDDALELEYVDDLYCVACNKSFKNSKARANHEESKKHKENVERLCQEMENEEDVFQQVDESLNELQLNGDEEEEEAENMVEEQEVPISKRDKKSKKSKKNAPKLLADEDTDEPADLKVKSDSEDEDDWNHKGKKSAKKNKSKKSNTSKPKEEQPNVEKRSEQTSASNPTSAASANAEDPQKPQHTCVTCRLCFDSKNKLFAHLKKTNHGVYIPKDKPNVEGKPPSAAKRGGKRNK